MVAIYEYTNEISIFLKHVSSVRWTRFQYAHRDIYTKKMQINLMHFSKD